MNRPDSHRAIRLSWIKRRAYGCWMLGVKWAAGWNAVPKSRQYRYSIWKWRHA